MTLGSDSSNKSRSKRYLFEAVKHCKRADDGEIVAIKSDLTLEHITPQGWGKNWPVPGFGHIPDGELDADKMAREVTRQQAINKLGNLTLLTHKLNARISNGAFAA